MYNSVMVNGGQNIFNIKLTAWHLSNDFMYLNIDIYTMVK